MGSNPPFLEASFDLETTQIMNQAFEFVCMALNNREDFERLKGKMAVYIIQAVRSGERDPVRLGAKAVKAYAFSGLSIPNHTVMN
jgi:hypothetical protein